MKNLIRSSWFNFWLPVALPFLFIICYAAVVSITDITQSLIYVIQYMPPVIIGYLIWAFIFQIRLGKRIRVAVIALVGMCFASLCTLAFILFYPLQPTWTQAKADLPGEIGSIILREKPNDGFVGNNTVWEIEIYGKGHKTHKQLLYSDGSQAETFDLSLLHTKSGPVIKLIDGLGSEWYFDVQGHSHEPIRQGMQQEIGRFVMDEDHYDSKLLFLRGSGRQVQIPVLKDSMICDTLDPDAGDTSANDDEGSKLQEAFDTTSSRNTVNVNIKALNEFSGPNRQILLRHLATSAKWRLTQDGDQLVAYRRFVQNGRWSSTLNGYYHNDPFPVPDNNAINQWRIAISPDGPVDYPFSNKEVKYRGVLVHENSGTTKLNVVRRNEKNQSTLIVTSPGGSTEIMAESAQSPYPFTAAALSAVEKELDAVLKSSAARNSGFDKQLMPSESVRIGRPELQLAHENMAEDYNIYAYVNPGEPGYVYAKVFSALNNIQLSADDVQRSSIEYTGWSKNPKETFFYNTLVDIYEAEDKRFPARFELWFKPNSGGRERKLISKIFRLNVDKQTKWQPVFLP